MLLLIFAVIFSLVILVGFGIVNYNRKQYEQIKEELIDTIRATLSAYGIKNMEKIEDYIKNSKLDIPSTLEGLRGIVSGLLERKKYKDAQKIADYLVKTWLGQYQSALEAYHREISEHEREEREVLRKERETIYSISVLSQILRRRKILSPRGEGFKILESYIREHIQKYGIPQELQQYKFNEDKIIEAARKAYGKPYEEILLLTMLGIPREDAERVVKGLKKYRKPLKEKLKGAGEKISGILDFFGEITGHKE